HNVMGGVREFQDEDAFAALGQEVKEPFLRSDVPEVIHVIDRHFGDHTYSLWHLFRDEQRKVLDQIRYSTLEEVEAALRQIYQNNYSIMTFLQGLQIPLPKAFRVAAEYTVDADLKVLFREDQVDPSRLESLLEEVRRWPLEIEERAVGHTASAWLDRHLRAWSGESRDLERLKILDRVLALLAAAPLKLDLRRAQNRYFELARSLSAPRGEAAAKGEEEARQWVELFAHLGEHLGVRVAP
ncbi:MAG: DUF3536 domain-containing protein, partial [Proteobacteria bacterium]|nr:DUF3536 domain-containing protein [Pseudomonadota bacterium]